MMELFYPLFLALNVRKMWMLNNRNRKKPLLLSIRLVATIFILTIIFVSTSTLVSASTSSNTTTTTTTTTNATSAGEEQEAVSNTTTTTNINPSAVLGNPFMIVEFETASVNPINETYFETSTLNNVTIMPPNATAGTTINAIETVNATINILPNGLALDKGQSLIVTEGDNGTAEQENATTTFVDISRMNPDGSGSGTGVVFFSTNSTGQLAFLDNMVGINDSEFSQGSGTIRVWEWKGETLPFEIDGSAPTMENQTTITTALEVEEE